MKRKLPPLGAGSKMLQVGWNPAGDGRAAVGVRDDTGKPGSSAGPSLGAEHPEWPSSLGVLIVG